MSFKLYETKQNEVTKAMEDMVKRGGDLRGYFNRVTYDEYKLLQVRRWKRYNSDKAFEGGRWEENKEPYKTWKRKKYKGYPYQGRRIGIRTGLLLQSVVGEKEGRKFHRKLVKPRSLMIFIMLEYAKYYDEARTFTTWSDGTMQRLRRGVRDYVRTGKDG
jgi:hypothetical protein